MQIPIIRDILKEANKEQYSKYLALMPDLKQEKAKKFTTIVLTLTTSILLGLFAINPTLSTIANLRKQIDDDNFVDQKLQEKIGNLATLQQKYSNLQNDLPVVYAAIPNSAQLATLVGEIQAIARDSNLKLNSFQTLEVDLTKAAAEKKSASFDFSFSGEGNYQQIMDTLDKMVNFQRILTVDNISISKKSGADENSEALQVSVKGTVFFKE